MKMVIRVFVAALLLFDTFTPHLCLAGDFDEGIPTETEFEIRKIIYEQPLLTGTRIIDGFPQVSLIIPERLKRAYQKHPLEVWALLQKIVEGARPSDSHTAKCYASALASNPVAVARTAHLSNPEKYDTIFLDTGRTRRAIFVLQMQHTAKLLKQKFQEQRKGAVVPAENSIGGEEGEPEVDSRE